LAAKGIGASVAIGAALAVRRAAIGDIATGVARARTRHALRILAAAARRALAHAIRARARTLVTATRRARGERAVSQKQTPTLVHKRHAVAVAVEQVVTEMETVEAVC
jgi:hypothetical protein